MRAVLDASAAVEVALNRGRALEFAGTLGEADVVLAPDLLAAEVTNVFWKYHQFNNLPLADCERALAAALALPDVFVPGKELSREAFLLARTLKKTAYDMFYLALARREDAVLVTSDAALSREAAKQNVRTA